MKRYLLFLLIPIIFSVTSCTKTQNVVPNQTILTSINSSNWTTSDGGKTYSAVINMPEINNSFNNYGGVLAYVTYDNATYIQIPEVFGGLTFSYTHNIGQIQIDVQASNGVSIISNPGNLGVKIVLIPSSY